MALTAASLSDPTTMAPAFLRNRCTGSTEINAIQATLYRCGAGQLQFSVQAILLGGRISSRTAFLCVQGFRSLSSLDLDLNFYLHI